MRSRSLTRLYLQVPPDEAPKRWEDARIWEELDARFEGADGRRPARGEVLEKSVTGMRSFVAEPMRFGRLFLAGDAAHIVPPTGAKGLNLAASDVKYLASGLVEHYRERSDAGLDHYSARALRRVWKAERFSWWFTMSTHRFPGTSDFDRRMQDAELDYLVQSTAAATALAENYVGLPL
jgi:p-hydroxybenzoate 3-monooxygenase